MNTYTPYFSIIVPTYNRGYMIRRAIDSCLRQDFTHFEIIIIDDGSSDDTSHVIQSYQDERIVYLIHDANRGVCEARNTGIEAARGAWYVMLDSDFELLDGALRKLAKRASTAGDDVGNLATTCLWESGLLTPSPSVPDHPVGYEEFLSWLDSVVVSEWFNCLRAEVFKEIRFPTGRVYEASFHLSVIKRWKLEIDREPIILFHTDAINRITGGSRGDKYLQMLRDAKDSAADSRSILKEHGSALQAYAPKKYYERVYLTGLLYFLSGDRGNGFFYTFESLRLLPIAFKPWAVMILGLLGRQPLAWVKSRF